MDEIQNIKIVWIVFFPGFKIFHFFFFKNKVNKFFIKKINKIELQYWTLMDLLNYSQFHQKIQTQFILFIKCFLFSSNKIKID